MPTVQEDRSPLASAQWRAWIVEHPFLGAAVAGGIATVLCTLTGYFLTGFGLPQLNWPAVNGALVVSKGSPGDQWFAGALIHYVDGVVFAVLFAVLLWRKIPLPNTSVGNLGKGLAYGTLLGLISIGFLVPYVYYPKIGLDAFGFGLVKLPQPTSVAGLSVLYKHIGWKLPFAILLWHWIYGFYLGVLYDPSKN